MQQTIPTKKGQVVRICNPLPGEDPNTEYVVAEDPTPYENNRQITIFPVSELLRVAKGGGIPFSNRIERGDLTVIGESLDEWLSGSSSV